MEGITMSSSSNVSLKDQQFISAACKQAQKSTVAMRNGCVAVSGGKIIAGGSNNYRASSRDGFLENTCTCHAEIATLRKVHTRHTNHTKTNFRLSLKVASHKENI